MVGVFEKISGIFSYTVNLEDLFQPQSADLALQKVLFGLYWSHLNTIQARTTISKVFSCPSWESFQPVGSYPEAQVIGLYLLSLTGAILNPRQKFLILLTKRPHFLGLKQIFLDLERVFEHLTYINSTQKKLRTSHLDFRQTLVENSDKKIHF